MILHPAFSNLCRDLPPASQNFCRDRRPAISEHLPQYLPPLKIFAAISHLAISKPLPCDSPSYWFCPKLPDLLWCPIPILNLVFLGVACALFSASSSTLCSQGADHLPLALGPLVRRQPIGQVLPSTPFEQGGSAELVTKVSRASHRYLFLPFFDVLFIIVFFGHNSNLDVLQFRFFFLCVRVWNWDIISWAYDFIILWEDPVRLLCLFNLNMVSEL